MYVNANYYIGYNLAMEKVNIGWNNQEKYHGKEEEIVGP